MQISPIPTLSDEINDIRTRTANIVAEKIIPNERDIYSKSENSSSIRKEIREEVKKENSGLLTCQKNMVVWELALWHMHT